MNSVFKDDSWTMATGQIDGRKVLARFRSSLPNPVDMDLLPYLVLLTWSYDSSESGMPGSDTTDRMTDLEAILENSVEKNSGDLVACITGNGRKEWRYYTYDTDRFMDKLNRGLSGHARFPIEITFHEDPEWRALKELDPAAHT